MIGFRFSTTTAKGGNNGPASLPLTGWWRAPFSAVPWVGTKSAGPSLGANLIRGAVETDLPTVSTTINGLAPATFANDNTSLRTESSKHTFLDPVSTGSGAGWILFQPQSAVGHSGKHYLMYPDAVANANIPVPFDFSGGLFRVFVDYQNNNCRVYVSKSYYVEYELLNQNFSHYFNTYDMYGSSLLGTSICLLQFRYENRKFSCRINNDPWTTQPVPAEFLRTWWYRNLSESIQGLDFGPNAPLRFGTLDSGSAHGFGGQLLEVGLTKQALSFDTFDKVVRPYCNIRYRISI